MVERLGSSPVVIRRKGKTTVTGGSAESRKRVKERLASGQSSQQATSGETSQASVRGSSASRRQTQRSLEEGTTGTQTTLVFLFLLFVGYARL